MSERDPLLRAIELQIKLLPWRARLGFMWRQFGHALVNLGPDPLREKAVEAAEDIRTMQSTLLNVVGIADGIDKFAQSRAMHWIGKIGFFVVASAVVAGVVWLIRFA